MILDALGQPVSQPAHAAPAKRLGLAASFGRYLGTVADGVHSGSGRTAFEDNNTDYYPVPLNADALRPGTVYADPYGHVLVIARRVAQTPDSGGSLRAGDRPITGRV